jgi:formamidopyrimidine-DNA glycosylase
VAARRGTIAAALLDQGRIAGMGNVFRAEVLHGMLMPPTRLASLVSVEEFAELWERLQPMMRQAVDDGRIITVEAEDRLAVPEAESRRVYKQELCTTAARRSLPDDRCAGDVHLSPVPTGVGGLSADADVHSVLGFRGVAAGTGPEAAGQAAG